MSPHEAGFSGETEEGAASSDWHPDRRSILQMMAASLAAAGLSACGRLSEQAVPYVAIPPGLTPGELQLYSTTLTRDGYGVGVVSRNRMARPLKIEGNPHHPASLGGTDAILEASLLALYDPDRARTVWLHREIATLNGLLGALLDRLPKLAKAHGKGLAILSETVTSPTLSRQRAALSRRYPEATWHRWDGGFRDAWRAAARRAFGRPVEPVLHVGNADVILAVDSDLLDDAPGHLAYARAFGRRRRELASGGSGNRLYAVESTPTLTGANADHRFIVRAAEIEPVLRALAARLGVKGSGAASSMGDAPDWLRPVADDLSRNHGRALIQIGPYQPASVQLLGIAINDALGAPGHTLDYIDPVELDTGDAVGSLSALVEKIEGGEIDTLLVLGGNPVFTAPPDLALPQAIGRVPFSIHLSTYVNETSAYCLWSMPQAHELESWGDARAFDGTASILQPQIEPLFGGWTAQQLIEVLFGNTRPSGYELIRQTWQEAAQQPKAGDFEDFWTQSLRYGVIRGTAAPALSPKFSPGAVSAAFNLPAKSDDRGTRVLFRPDPWLRDGSHANNAYLQELPRPLTKMTWGNVALIPAKLAEEFSIDTGQICEISTRSGSVRAPAWIMPGQAEDSLTLLLGFGRQVGGHVGTGIGFNAFPLRSRTGLSEAPLESLVLTTQRASLATTQLHDRMKGESHSIVRHGPVAEFRRDPTIFHATPPKESLYAPYPYPKYAWGMAINLSSCIGCSACVAACEVENNTPVVGKAEVLLGREMQWLRIDRYYVGEMAAPSETLFQPVPCMQCEDAPCEVVCPVDATMHDHDGLNVMVYNRCIGTRFCSNNCPYKVRRFNYIDYAARDPRLDLAWNPELSVRGRGVMEKCTYCIQRIRQAEIRADRENRLVPDGEVKTACQVACPTDAIVFGNLDDPQSEVRRRKATPLNYGIFDELNTRPRTTYEARLTNPNPAVKT